MRLILAAARLFSLPKPLTKIGMKGGRPHLIGLKALVVSLLLSESVPAQQVSVGGRFGVPLTKAFDPSQGTLSLTNSRLSYNSQTQRFVIGPAVEFVFPRGIGIEVDALYQRLHFDGQHVGFTPIGPGIEGASGGSSSTSAGLWEFPLLFKYRFPLKPVRPYVSAGPSVSRVAGIRHSTECFSFIGPCRGGGVIEEPSELRSRSAVGFVLGGGVGIALSRMRVSPEIRYVHQGREQFLEPVAGLIRSNKGRLYFLLGLSF
jgi:opacity protein-like surface antigen